MRQQVVILSDHTLFSQGVASRFAQFSERVQMNIVNPVDDDCFKQIAAINPDAIILSSSEVKMKESCLLCELISAFPSLRIIRLAVDQDPVQVITSKHSQINEIRDLLELINVE